MSAIKEIELPLRYKMRFLHDILKDDLKHVRDARCNYKADPSDMNKELLRMALHSLADTKKAIREKIGLH